MPYLLSLPPHAHCLPAACSRPWPSDPAPCPNFLCSTLLVIWSPSRLETAARAVCLPPNPPATRPLLTRSLLPRDPLARRFLPTASLRPCATRSTSSQPSSHTACGPAAHPLFAARTSSVRLLSSITVCDTLSYYRFPLLTHFRQVLHVSASRCPPACHAPHFLVPFCLHFLRLPPDRSPTLKLGIHTPPHLIALTLRCTAPVTSNTHWLRASAGPQLHRAARRPFRHWWARFQGHRLLRRGGTP
jgi:hypothetical protein